MNMRYIKKLISDAFKREAEKKKQECGKLNRKKSKK